MQGTEVIATVARDKFGDRGLSEALKNTLLRAGRSFRELERRISGLATNGERGAAFEVFAEGLSRYGRRRKSQIGLAGKQRPALAAQETGFNLGR
jgi:hypothetical protein